ncbi:MAG: thioredoxin family protein [Bryobacteraceae bacterium]
MIDLTAESFVDFISTHRHAVIHFWAAWNAYDVEVKQFLEKDVPVDLQHQIAFGRFDIDPPAHWEICRRHHVVNVPFFALYRDGAVLETLTGKRGADVFLDHLRRLLA